MGDALNPVTDAIRTESGGDFASTGFSSNVDDLVLATRHLAETVAPATLLVGHLLGGAAGLAAAARLPDVRAVVTIGAPRRSGAYARAARTAAGTAARDGQAEVEPGGRQFTIRDSIWPISRSPTTAAPRPICDARCSC